MITFEITFWLSLALVGYSYVGYPFLLWVLSFFRAYDVVRGNSTPSVTYIVTAYNEEKRIAEKLDNTLALTYPSALLEILVASDCSSDNTDAIVSSYAGRGIRLVRSPKRKGKEAAQELAVEIAKGEILVFSDVATILPKDAISNIVRSFQDPTVGCVSSVDRFIDQDGRVSGEGAYVKYEMFLRSLETRVNSLVGLSGSFFAARRIVCQPWADDLQSDFSTLLNSISLGMRGVSDQTSVGYYKNLASEQQEYQRKVRTVVRGLSVLARRRGMLNPFRHGLFSWQLFSHKLCRWLVPFGLLAALVSNLVLVSYTSFFMCAFIIQLCFYGIATVGVVSIRARRSMVRLAAFFVMVNVSILDAWIRFFRGQRVVAWESSRR
jgi:glycosyltransferase involved in cell wall biosynthesis